MNRVNGSLYHLAQLVHELAPHLGVQQDVEWFRSNSNVSAVEIHALVVPIEKLKPVQFRQVN